MGDAVRSNFIDGWKGLCIMAVIARGVARGLRAAGVADPTMDATLWAGAGRMRRARPEPAGMRIGVD